MSLNKLKGKDFINLEDFNSAEIFQLIELGIKLKKKTRGGKNLDILKGKIFSCILQNPVSERD